MITESRRARRSSGADLVEPRDDALDARHRALDGPDVCRLVLRELGKILNADSETGGDATESLHQHLLLAFDHAIALVVRERLQVPLLRQRRAHVFAILSSADS